MNLAAFLTYVIKIPGIELVSITLYTYKERVPCMGQDPMTSQDWQMTLIAWWMEDIQNNYYIEILSFNQFGKLHFD